MSVTSIFLANRYRLDAQIAAGGVGEVWRATDTALSRPVAVKLLRAEYAEQAEALARFRAEARHAGSLSHPGIARVYDYGEDCQPYPPYLVMELVNGPSLADLLERGRLGPSHSMHVVAQAAAGLAAAHAAGLVHRDIKPANLLLNSTGQVKITDFGIAHAAGSAPLTRTGMLIGTPAYLAPERVAGASGTPAADLYALGVVAYECLAGVPPFGGEPIVVAAAHRDRPLPRLPPEVPAAIADLVQELTRKDPGDRPGSAQAVAERAAMLRDAPGPPGPAGSTATGGGCWPAAAPGRAAPAVTQAIPLPAAPPAAPSRSAGRAGAWAAAGRPASRRWGGRVHLARPWPLRSVAVAVAAVALAAGLAGWLLAGIFQVARSAGPAAATHPASSPARGQASRPAPPRSGPSTGKHDGHTAAAHADPGRPDHRAGHPPGGHAADAGRADAGGRGHGQPGGDASHG